MPNNPTEKLSLSKRYFSNAWSSRDILGLQRVLAAFRARNPILKDRTVTALADSAATLTAAQVIDSGLFTITPTAGRAITLPAPADIINYLDPDGSVPVGTSFEITIIALAAQTVTLTANGNSTIVGSATCSNSSATWVGVVTGAASVVFYRK